MLQELGHVEQDGEDGDGKEVLQQPTPLSLTVSDHGVVVVRSGDSYEPLQSHPNCHQDGASHGDVTQGIQKLRGQQLVITGVHVRTYRLHSQERLFQIWAFTRGVD